MDHNLSLSLTYKLYKLLNKSTIIVTSFSVKPEDVPILEQFRQIAKREAGPRGFSQVLVKAMEEYNKRHGIGNPQMLITHYAKPEEPQPMRVLCIYCQGALTDGRIFCQRKACGFQAFNVAGANITG